MANEPPHTLTVEGVSKQYGSLRALESVSVEFKSGEVHAILGENGAGKSTLMGIIAGFVKPSSGAVLLDGKAIPHGKPSLCRKAGIAMVHQHFTLSPGMTEQENFALAQLEGPTSIYSPKRQNQAFAEASKSLGWDLNGNSLVDDLSVGAQQRLEIIKNIRGDSTVIVFDEPTAPLAPEEVADLLQSLRRIASQNKIVLLIAHKLNEVLAVADRITVLRKGEYVGTLARSEANESVLLNMMLGETPVFNIHKEGGSSQPGLAISKLVVKGDLGNIAVRDLELEVNRGEILGIGGVDGNGQLELTESILRIRPTMEGTVKLPGGSNCKFGYIPGDRRREGLATNLSVWENLFIGNQGDQLGMRTFVLPRRIKTWAQKLVAAYEIKVSSVRTRVSSLSGGNQQKVVVSRELEKNPDLIIAVNPTRGLDVRATEYVHQKLFESKQNGAAVLLISADLDELAIVADRTLFMNKGKIYVDLSSLANAKVSSE